MSDRFCGCCRRWEMDKSEKRPASLKVTVFTGKCKLSGKATGYGDMSGCFGFKAVEQESGKEGEGNGTIS